MFWSFAAPKGGVGVSAIAAAVASTLSRQQSVTVVDFCGDQPDIFGCSEETPSAPGVFDWLEADGSVSADALDNLSIEVSSSLRILPPGSRSSAAVVSAHRCVELVEHLGRSGPVIADVGVVGRDLLSEMSVICGASDRTTLVVRACYLVMRRARMIPIVADDVVEVVEGGRSLRTVDIELVLQQPVISRVPFDPAIARALDAGLVGRRLPRPMSRMVADLCAVETALAGAP